MRKNSAEVPQKLTKIDIAEAELKTAIRLFFEDTHPVPIYTLAAAAREILTTIGGRTGVRTVLHNFADRKGISLQDAEKDIRRFVNFFKHANRDPAAVLENFSDLGNDILLWIASHDFGRVAGGMPIEAQVFEAWFYAITVKRVSDGGLKWQRIVKRCIQLFPGIRSSRGPSKSA